MSSPVSLVGVTLVGLGAALLLDRPSRSRGPTEAYRGVQSQATWEKDEDIVAYLEPSRRRMDEMSQVAAGVRWASGQDPHAPGDPLFFGEYRITVWVPDESVEGGHWVMLPQALVVDLPGTYRLVRTDLERDARWATPGLPRFVWIYTGPIQEGSGVHTGRLDLVPTASREGGGMAPAYWGWKGRLHPPSRATFGAIQAGSVVLYRDARDLVDATLRQSWRVPVLVVVKRASCPMCVDLAPRMAAAARVGAPAFVVHTIVAEDLARTLPSSLRGDFRWDTTQVPQVRKFVDGLLVDEADDARLERWTAHRPEDAVSAIVRWASHRG